MALTDWVREVAGGGGPTIGLGSSARAAQRIPPSDKPNDGTKLKRTKPIAYNQQTALQSSLVAAMVRVYRDGIVEAPPIVEELKDNKWIPVPEHPLVDWYTYNPNPYYSGRLMLQSTVSDIIRYGIAYHHKLRNASNAVIGLEWLPADKVTVVAETGVSLSEDPTKHWIRRYEYTPGGSMKAQRIPPEDIVHFIYMQDPNNPRVGIPPLKNIAAELFSDFEAGSLLAYATKNKSGMVLIAAKEKDGIPDKYLKDTSETIKKLSTGERNGRVVLMNQPVTVHEVSGVNTEDIRPIRIALEERASAVMGPQASIVGFSAGERRLSYSSYDVARKVNFESAIVSMQNLIAAEINRSLLPDTVDGRQNAAKRYRFRFDNSEVPALQETKQQIRREARENFKAKGINLAEFREILGMPVRPGDEGVYYDGTMPQEVVTVNNE